MKVYVITRFGLGQSQESFYERELIYLENFLAKSVNAQKKFITKWIILTDIKIPGYIHEKIKKLAPSDLLHIHLHNPFLENTIRPNITKILESIGVKINDKIVEVRIDADDVFSNDYISNILNFLSQSKITNKFEKVLLDAPHGIYFYPTHKKLIRVYKKNFSIQALYSIFNNNFFSTYDYGHQNLETKVIENSGFCHNLKNQDVWIRSMRHYTVTRFGKPTSIFEGRFIFIKQIIKKLLRKDLSNKITYKNTIKINNVLNRFQITSEIMQLIQKHENSIKNHNIKFSFSIKKIIDRKKIKSPFVLKKILLEMYKNEQCELKKEEIKESFYSF